MTEFERFMIKFSFLSWLGYLIGNLIVFVIRAVS